MKASKLFAAVLCVFLLLSCAVPAAAADELERPLLLSVVNYADGPRVTRAVLYYSCYAYYLSFSLEGDSYDMAHEGRPGTTDDVSAVYPDGSFQLRVSELMDAPFIVSLHRADSGVWETRQFRVYADSGDMDVWEDYGAVPTTQRLTVDGVERTTEIYNIGGYNYFKLRDIAALLSGTAAQFFVDYDGAFATVIIRSGEPYEPQPGDLVTGLDRSASALPTMQGITLNGELIEFENVYNIGGNNFIKLRDMGEALGFGVGYDEATRTMQITTK